MYAKYKSRGFEVLAFPCNQFGGQEPGTNADIRAFIQKSGVEFPVFSKIDVNGADESELYTFLKRSQRGVLGKRVIWNFTKFLVDRNGKPVARFGPQQSPKSIEARIKHLL